MTTDFREAVSQIRAQIDESNAIIQRAQNAMVPQEEAMRRLDEDIRARADSCVARATGYVVQQYSRPTLVGQAQNPGAHGLINLEVVGNILCAVVPDGVRAFLAADLAAFYADEAGVTQEERDAVIAHHRAKVFEWEVSEERVIAQAATAGVQIARRRGSNPAAILAVTDD